MPRSDSSIQISESQSSGSLSLQARPISHPGARGHWHQTSQITSSSSSPSRGVMAAPGHRDPELGTREPSTFPHTPSEPFPMSFQDPRGGSINLTFVHVSRQLGHSPGSRGPPQACMEVENSLYPATPPTSRDGSGTLRGARGKINLDPPDVHQTLRRQLSQTRSWPLLTTVEATKVQRLSNLPKVTQPHRARNTLFDPGVWVFRSTRHTGFPEFSVSHL